MTSGSEETMPLHPGGAAQGAATPPPSSPPPAGAQAQQPTLAAPASQSGAPTAFSLSGTGGLPPVSRNVQDLSQDKLLLSAPRVTVDGKPTPSLGGIPLLHKLGQGGMGAVYYGIHPRLKVEVAVKVLPFHLAGQQPGLIERFFREAQIAAKVQSPNLVNVKDVNEDSGLFYLVMEYVHGTSAGSYLKQMREMGRPGLPEAEALQIAIAASQGLKAAHDENVVHRDIKPDNIMVPKSKGGEQLLFKSAKLADLGLARGEDGSQQSLTGQSVALGTPGYMSPEQADDARNAGKPADVFSMGAALYALLTGGAPFKGDSLMQIFFATAQKPHEPVQKLRPDASPASAALIDRCLSKDPAQRPPDATALLAELQRCVDGLGQRTGEEFAPTMIGAGAPARAVAEAQTPSLAAARTEPAPVTIPGVERVKPTGWLKILALTGLVLLALGIVADHLRKKDAQERFAREREAAVAKALEARTAHGAALLQAIGTLEQFKQDHGDRAFEEFKPVEDALNTLGARQEALDKRRDEFLALAAEARRLIPTDPDAALKGFDTAATFGAAVAKDNLPDLTGDLKPSLEDLRAEAKLSAAQLGKRKSDEALAQNRKEFEEGYHAANGLAGGGDWAAAEKTVARALESLGRQDHIAREAAEALQKRSREELAQRENFRQHMLEAGRSFKQNKFLDAKAAYERALLAWPGSPEAEKARAGIASALQGLKHLSYEAAMTEGQEALRGRKWDLAETAFGRALFERRDDPAAKKGLADAQNGRRDQSYLQALASGNQLLAEKKYEAAAMAFNSALNEKRTPEAEKGLKAAREGFSNDRYDAALEEARKLAADKKWTEAERALSRALQEKPNDPVATTGWYLVSGYRKLEQRDWAAAEANFNRVLRDHPDNKSAREGLAFAQKNRDTGYQEAFERARDKAATAKSVADWQVVLAASNEALAARPNDKPAADLKRRAESEIDRLTWPTLKVGNEGVIVSFRTVKVDGKAVKADTPVAIEPGAHRVEIDVNMVFGKDNDFARTVTLRMERGRAYEIRIAATRRGAGPVKYELKLFVDGKRAEL